MRSSQCRAACPEGWRGVGPQVRLPFLWLSTNSDRAASLRERAVPRDLRHRALPDDGLAVYKCWPKRMPRILWLPFFFLVLLFLFSSCLFSPL